MKTRAISLLLLLSLAASLFYACKKDQNTIDQHAAYDETVYTPKAAKLVQDITRFKQKITHVRENPQLKSGEVISKEDARWNLETLFNATYGFPDLTYRKTITDTALLYLPVDASGNALLEDVVAVYDEILSRVTGFYINSNFDEKGFLFMQLSSRDVMNGQLEIKLSAVTGARTNIPDPPQEWKPFGEGDNWWFGQLKGNCVWEQDDTDAAKEIEHFLNTNRRVPPPPPNGYRYIYVNDSILERFGDEYLDNDGNYLIYYIEQAEGNFSIDEKCLDDEELNFHYFGQREVIYNIIPEEENKPDNWVFMTCELTGQQAHNIDNTLCLHHKNKLTYAFRYIVPTIEIDFPVELLARLD